MEIALAKENSECCGCGTCALVCPVNAICMIPGELGCLYPHIDPEKCIRCHACENVCAYSKAAPVRTEKPRAFAVAAKDPAVLKKSASGGVFASLAHSILDAGGIVYGCSLEMENGVLTPKHIAVETHAEVNKLQGSKYVQSRLGTVFPEIRQMLRQRRIVLFSGTPCQVDALRHYLKDTDTENLFTSDLICHGVPGAELFQAYLQHLGKRGKGMVTAFSFRDKSNGWGLQAAYSVRGKNGMENRKTMPSGISSYYTFFLESEIYRESCYTCRYANTTRVGDITIGDFWGIEQEHPEWMEENGGNLRVYDGVSAVLANNPKGERLLTQYGQNMDIAESGLDKVTKWNRQLCGPSRHSAMRQKLVNAWLAEGYRGMERIFRKRLGIRYPVRLVRARLQERKIHGAEDVPHHVQE